MPLFLILFASPEVDCFTKSHVTVQTVFGLYFTVITKSVFRLKRF